LVKNPTQHFGTKHIEISHHFIHDHVKKGDISFEFVVTDKQIVNIFTKSLSEDKFSAFQLELSIGNPP
jgi:hypothetical protein